MDLFNDSDRVMVGVRRIWPSDAGMGRTGRIVELGDGYLTRIYVEKCNLLVALKRSLDSASIWDVKRGRKLPWGVPYDLSNVSLSIEGRTKERREFGLYDGHLRKLKEKYGDPWEEVAEFEGMISDDEIEKPVINQDSGVLSIQEDFEPEAPKDFVLELMEKITRTRSELVEKIFPVWTYTGILPGGIGKNYQFAENKISIEIWNRLMAIYSKAGMIVGHSVCLIDLEGREVLTEIRACLDAQEQKTFPVMAKEPDSQWGWMLYHPQLAYHLCLEYGSPWIKKYPYPEYYRKGYRSEVDRVVIKKKDKDDSLSDRLMAYCEKFSIDCKFEVQVEASLTFGSVKKKATGETVKEATDQVFLIGEKYLTEKFGYPEYSPKVIEKIHKTVPKMEMVTVNGRSYVAGYYRWLIKQTPAIQAGKVGLCEICRNAKAIRTEYLNEKSCGTSYCLDCLIRKTEKISSENQVLQLRASAQGWKLIDLNQGREMGGLKHKFVVLRSYHVDYNDISARWMVQLYSQDRNDDSGEFKWLWGGPWAWTIDGGLMKAILIEEGILESMVINPDDYWADRQFPGRKLAFQMDDFNPNQVTKFIERLEKYYLEKATLTRVEMVELDSQELIDLIYDNPYLKWSISMDCPSVRGHRPVQASVFRRKLALLELNNRLDPMLTWPVCQSLIKGRTIKKNPVSNFEALGDLASVIAAENKGAYEFICQKLKEKNQLSSAPSSED